MESRSTFVTVLAWMFIVGSGFATFISIMQVIMVTTMFSGDEFSSVPKNAPAMAKFMSQHFNLLIYAFFVLASFTFISSIALLKRKNWARLAFIAILAIGILWQAGGVAIQLTMFSDFPAPPKGEGFDDFERMSTIIRWFSIVIALAVSGVFIWLIKKLTTQSISREFTLNNSGSSDRHKMTVGS